MTPSGLFHKWMSLLPPHRMGEFADDLIGVVKCERDRMRRQLTTDRTAYEAACQETMSEIEAHGGICG